MILQLRAVDVVVLGNGTPEQATWFREDAALDIAVYTDPTRAAYCALRAKRNLLGILHPKVFLRAFQARRRGFRQTGIKGDAQQLGGVFLIMPDGTLPYAYYSTYAGDHPAPEAVLAAVRAAQRPAGGRTENRPPGSA